MEHELIRALDGIAAAINRMADVYLYCNDPEPEDDETGPPADLPPDFKGMR